MKENTSATIWRVLGRESGARDVADLWLSRARRTHVCGIGTSWHAALVGEAPESV